MLPLASADPSQIDSYQLSGVLGRGGQGSVYFGENADGAKVAVKVLHAQVSDEQAYRRFMREAEAARRVAPFCTARVLDVGVADGRPYIVSEFIAGPSLERLVKGEGKRFGSGLERLGVATLTALAAIHRAGVVHRDFKPGNVIMGAEGPVVIDFGIARALDQTATSSVMGTPAFMAPEQFESAMVGPAADLFSWASTMVYAATGQQAFKGDTMPALMYAILTAESDLSGVPESLRPLLARCLAKDPAVRPGIEELLGLLTGQEAGVSVAREMGALPTLPAPGGPAPQPSGTLLLPDPASGPQGPAIPVSGPHGPATQGPGMPGSGPQGPAVPGYGVAWPGHGGPGGAPVMGFPGAQGPGFQARGSGVRPAAPQLAASVVTMVLMGLLALTLFFNGVEVFVVEAIMPRSIMISMALLILVVPAFCVAVWRHSVASAISMGLVIPLALLFLAWGLVLPGEDDMPGVLLAIIPALLLGLVIAAASLLLWRLGPVAAITGGIGGLLLSLETLTHLAAMLMDGSISVLRYTIVITTRFTLGAWALVIGILLVVRAVQGRNRSHREPVAR
ncbi:serine/threonine-protein kinase [Nonomuraea sp. bgisy101]|uniref:serine/threonine-protein kinase n=1 Tax=Nonomuraea sp. bgisy101 TaxID=3413784 RepID=UPI003D744FA5